MVDGQHARESVPRVAVERCDESRVADHDVGGRGTVQASGEVAHLVEVREVSPLELEVRVWHRGADPLLSGTQPRAITAD
jgi:hypothetical protein